MLKHETYQLDHHGLIHVYIPETVINNSNFAPLVLDLNCTTGNPEAEVKTNGWDQVADEEGFILIAPNYNDYATYSECSYMKWVIEDAITRYPVDASRIYAVGFSNGGALAGALASTYPSLLAGIGAMGWMIGLNHPQKLTIPFILIQGTNEYTQTINGYPSIMDDEREALRDLMATNHLSTARPNYRQTPYWGYQPDGQRTFYPRYHDYDPYGNNQHLQTDKQWQINEYYREDYDNPFAELVLVEDAPHIPHDCNARTVWDFLCHFRRMADGQIKED